MAGQLEPLPWISSRDVTPNVWNGLFLASDDPLHQIANRDHPATMSSSTTGRWRKWCLVMMAMHSSTVFCGVTKITGLAMISRIRVSFDNLPSG